MGQVTSSKDADMLNLVLKRRLTAVVPVCMTVLLGCLTVALAPAPTRGMLLLLLLHFACMLLSYSGACTPWPCASHPCPCSHALSPHLWPQHPLPCASYPAFCSDTALASALFASKTLLAARALPGAKRCLYFEGSA